MPVLAGQLQSSDQCASREQNETNEWGNCRIPRSLSAFNGIAIKLLLVKWKETSMEKHGANGLPHMHCVKNAHMHRHGDIAMMFILTIILNQISNIQLLTDLTAS